MTPEQSLKSIGQKLRTRMTEKGFGIDSLSELTGVAKNTILAIGRGENTTLSTLIKLMIPLEMDFGDFKDVIGTASGAKRVRKSFSFTDEFGGGLYTSNFSFEEGVKFVEDNFKRGKIYRIGRYDGILDGCALFSVNPPMGEKMRPVNRVSVYNRRELNELLKAQMGTSRSKKPKN